MNIWQHITHENEHIMKYEHITYEIWQHMDLNIRQHMTIYEHMKIYEHMITYEHITYEIW